MPELESIAWVGVPLLTFAAAFGGLRMAFNGTRQKVDQIHEIVSNPEHGNVALHQRIRNIEKRPARTDGGPQ